MHRDTARETTTSPHAMHRDTARETTTTTTSPHAMHRDTARETTTSPHAMHRYTAREQVVNIVLCRSDGSSGCSQWYRTAAPHDADQRGRKKKGGSSGSVCFAVVPVWTASVISFIIKRNFSLTIITYQLAGTPTRPSHALSENTPNGMVQIDTRVLRCDSNTCTRNMQVCGTH